MLLATVVEWSLPAAPDRYADVARAMGLGSAADLRVVLEED